MMGKMTAAEKFLERARPCKIGTVPKVVLVHGSDRVSPGNRIRIKEGVGAPWSMVTVTYVDGTDHFFADR
jgi:hypothetical protein